MKIKYFIRDGESEEALFDSVGVVPVIGQFVYVHDHRNLKHFGPKTKYEVIRVDISASLEWKSMAGLDSAVRSLLHSDKEDEASDLIGGTVFHLNFVEKQIEFSTTHVEVLLKKIS